VFTGGTGRKVGRAFPDDRPVTLLLAAAERRRLAGYAALRTHLASAAFRETGIALAALALDRPWRHAVPEDAEEARHVAELRQSDLRDYAARALRRRFARVVAPGADLQGLPLPALHDIRLQAKRLRYAAEFFSPLFPGRQTRRFLRRMSALQERLGLINDGVVAQTLMAELPGRGPGRAYATGVVRGFVAAQTAGGLRKLDRSWQRFLHADPFWE
jgi:CHAD domain-containing protein